MKIDIDNMTEAELLELNHRIVQRLKFLDSMHHHHEMLKFNVGDKVSFEPPGRGRLTGTLVKYNQKTVTIITDAGQRWNVAPSLLSKIKPVAAAAQDNVIINFDSKKKT
jgi:hypothetical protein